MPEWVSTAEAAELTGYHVNHIRRLILTGKIAAQRFGPMWKIDRRVLLAYVKTVERLGGKRGPKRGP